MISKESYFVEALSFAKELNDKEKINLVRYIVLMSKNS